MKTIVLVVGWSIGFVSAAASLCYVIGLVFYVADGTVLSALAYTPKWIFPLSLLLLLGKTEELRALVARIDEHFDQEAREAKKAQEDALRKEWHE